MSRLARLSRVPQLVATVVGLLALLVVTGVRGQEPPPAFENPTLRYPGPMPRPTAPEKVAQVPSIVHDLPTNPLDGGPLLPNYRYDWQSGAVIELDPEQMICEEFGCPVLTKPISPFKSGFFQKLSLTGTWIDRGKAESFGLTEVESFVTVAVPAPVREWPLLISPTYNLRFLNGPATVSLPPRLHEAFVDFMWVPRFNERLIGILSVAPSIYSDFEVDEADAFRLTGKALARYDVIPDRLQLVAGVLYLNRQDIRLLPAGGILWQPTDDWNFELIFPKPKISRRLIYAGDFEDWIYLGAEFGGNSFAVERLPGVVDELTLFDMRTYVGLERKRDGGAGRRLEIGYVFNRTAEFASGAPGVDGAATAMLRGVVTF